MESRECERLIPPGNHYKPDNAKIRCALLHQNWVEEKSFSINFSLDIQKIYI